MRWLVILLLLTAGSAAPCRSVDRDRITAEDLATEIAPFRELDAQLLVGPAPGPGTHRTFSTHELTALATRHGIQFQEPPAEVCFERALQPLSPDRILAALRSALGTEEVSIELVDFTQQPLPSGELVFPRSGLTRPQAPGIHTPALWRGTLRYAPSNTMAVWATVRLRQRRPIVVARRAIRCGAPISSDDVELEASDIFPFTAHVETLADAIGRVARKTIPAGTLVSAELIEVPPDVAAGETVKVTVIVGQARVTFDAVARSQGRKGDRILLLNPESRRTFRAFLDGKGRAHIGGGS